MCSWEHLIELEHLHQPNFDLKKDQLTESVAIFLKSTFYEKASYLSIISYLIFPPKSSFRRSINISKIFLRQRICWCYHQLQGFYLVIIQVVFFSYYHVLYPKWSEVWENTRTYKYHTHYHTKQHIQSTGQHQYRQHDALNAWSTATARTSKSSSIRKSRTTITINSS